jgi:2'-hydroxyisoflavone reductase
MKLLMIGGTKFLGRAYVDEALARGDEVTIFTRGQTNPSAYGDEVLQLRGDRTSDLSALHGGTWDVVVDTCGYDPAVVEKSAALLRDSVGQYVFVSSLSVYQRWDGDESATLVAADDQDDAGHYGYNKAQCEQVVERHFPGRSVHLRAGLIVGPHEDVGRLPYWLAAAAREPVVVAPAPPERTIQLIDARDIAAFTLRLADQRGSGPYNVTTPEGEQTFRDLVVACLDVTDSAADVVWADDAALHAAGIEPWTGLPLWLPPELGSWSTGVTRAQEAGLVCRPLHDTVADTWEWLRHVEDYQPRWPYATPDKLAAVLAAAR